MQIQLHSLALINNPRDRQTNDNANDDDDFVAAVEAEHFCGEMTEFHTSI